MLYVRLLYSVKTDVNYTYNGILKNSKKSSVSVKQQNKPLLPFHEPKQLQNKTFPEYYQTHYIYSPKTYTGHY